MHSEMAAAKIPPVCHLEIIPGQYEVGNIAQRVMTFDPQAIVVRLPLPAIVALLAFFDQEEFFVPVFIPWIPGVQGSDLTGKYRNPIMYVQPFATANNPAYSRFACAYQDRFGMAATPSAAYTYDAVWLLIQSVTSCNLQRASLRDAIAGMSVTKGVTGEVVWDNCGGNVTEPVLLKLDKKSPTAD
jgi:ABC-type branched-subunit amino acid transport system substrate-binding protein